MKKLIVLIMLGVALDIFNVVFVWKMFQSAGMKSSVAETRMPADNR